jgi:hypothetical protein
MRAVYDAPCTARLAPEGKAKEPMALTPESAEEDVCGGGFEIEPSGNTHPRNAMATTLQIRAAK